MQLYSPSLQRSCWFREDETTVVDNFARSAQHSTVQTLLTWARLSLADVQPALRALHHLSGQLVSMVGSHCMHYWGTRMAKQKAEMSWKVLERELAFILGTWAWQAARLLGESLRQALIARPED